VSVVARFMRSSRERGRKIHPHQGAGRCDQARLGDDHDAGEPAELGTRTESMRRGISVIFQHANLVPS